MSRTVKLGRRDITIRETIVDRVVGYFSPQAGMERLRARVTMEAWGGYKGGKRDRRQTRSWRPSEGSANADTLPDLPDLRARTRDLARNMPIATGAIATVVTNAVGEGLTVAPSIDQKLLGLTDEQKEEWESQAATEFNHAAECADFTKALCFEEMQALALRSVLESGDVFAVRRYREDPGEIYGTKLQLVEADRVSNPDRVADRQGMVGGIAINVDGVATGYSISDRHPGDYLITGSQALKWTEVPARDPEGRPLVLHLYDRLRPDQARGVPYLAPVIEILKVLGDYSDSEATAALVASMFTAFVTSQQDEDGNVQPIAGYTDQTTAANEFKLGSGAVIDLAPGEDVKFANPLRPNSGFDAFVMAVCRQIGVALELPYELLIKHFTASYSASRAALETAWQFFRRRRAWTARRFCQPYYEWVIYEAVARQRLIAPGFFENPLIRKAWLGAYWNGPARISLDQYKDAQADDLNLRNQLTTRERIIQERFGGTFEDTLSQAAKEDRALEGAGLKPQPAAATVANSAAPQPGEPPADGGNDTEGADQA